MARWSLLPDYRALDSTTRRCFYNFYRVNLLQGYTSIDAIYPDVQRYRQPQMCTITDWYWDSWTYSRPHLAGPSWTPQSESVGPPRSLRIASPWELTAVNALLYAQAYPHLHSRTKYKIRRTYNTGISRRRQNLPRS